MQRAVFCAVAIAVLLPFPACASGHGTLAADVDWKGSDGKVAYEIEADDRGFEVTDTSKAKIADYRWVESSLRMRAGTKVLGFVRADAGGLLVVDDAQKELWRLQPDGKDNWVLRSPTGIAYKLERRGDGYKVTDGAGTETARVKVDADDVSIRTPAGKTVWKSKLRLSTLAASCMSFDALPIEQRLGLLVGVVGFRVGE
jgi:hypothetical protein